MEREEEYKRKKESQVIIGSPIHPSLPALQSLRLVGPKPKYNARVGFEKEEGKFSQPGM